MREIRCEAESIHRLIPFYGCHEHRWNDFDDLGGLWWKRDMFRAALCWGFHSVPVSMLTLVDREWVECPGIRLVVARLAGAAIAFRDCRRGLSPPSDRRVMIPHLAEKAAPSLGAIAGRVDFAIVSRLSWPGAPTAIRYAADARENRCIRFSTEKAMPGFSDLYRRLGCAGLPVRL